jgi:hypothetical protein
MGILRLAIVWVAALFQNPTSLLKNPVPGRLMKLDRAYNYGERDAGGIPWSRTKQAEPG